MSLAVRFGTWQKVEAVRGAALKLRVLAVPHGGPEHRDSYNTYWERDTALWVESGDSRPVSSFHGFKEALPQAMGRATFTTRNADGQWCEIVLNGQHARAGEYYRAALAGEVYASSGAVAHLVRIAPFGKVEVWPVGEIALCMVTEGEMPANTDAVVRPLEEAFRSAGIVAPKGFAFEANRDGGVGGLAGALGMARSDDMELEVIKKAVAEALAEAAKDPGTRGAPDDVDAVVDAVLARLNAPGGGHGQTLQNVRGAPAFNRLAPRGFGLEEQEAAFVHWMRRKDAKPAHESGLRADPFLGYGNPVQTMVQGQDGQYRTELLTEDNTGAVLLPESWINKIHEPVEDKTDWLGAELDIHLDDAEIVNFPKETTAMGNFEIVTVDIGDSTLDLGQTDAPVLGLLPVQNYLHKKAVPVSKFLIGAAPVNLGAYVQRRIIKAKALTRLYWFLHGTGSNQPQGCLAGGTSQATAGSATVLTAPEVIALYNAMDDEVQDTGHWVAKKSVRAEIAALTTTNPLAFQVTANPDTKRNVPGPLRELLGSPFHTERNMPETAIGLKSLLFVSPSRAYAAVGSRNMAAMYLRERYAERGLDVFLVFDRMGGRVIDATAAQYITQA